MLRKLRSSVEKKDGTKDRTNISQYFSSGYFFMSHPQRRDFLYQLLQYRMQISIRGNNMMPFYKILIPIKVSHPAAGFQHQQCGSRIIPFADERLRPGAGGFVVLVIDATTGQNGLAQAKEFNDALDLDGLIVTKLDGTAKGGIALAISDQLGLPIYRIGVGESIDDLETFDALDFCRALVGEGK